MVLPQQGPKWEIFASRWKDRPFNGWVGHSCLKVNLQPLNSLSFHLEAKISYFGPCSGNTKRDQLGCTYLDSDCKTSPWDPKKSPWQTPLVFLSFSSILVVAKFHCTSLLCLLEVWKKWWNAIWVELDTVVWGTTSNHEMVYLSTWRQKFLTLHPVLETP